MAGSTMPATRYYQSGVATAEASMPTAPAMESRSSGPVQAFTTTSLDDPALAAFVLSGLQGGRLSDKEAFRNATFFRAVNLTAGAIGMLPLHLLRKAGKTTEKATDHPLFRILHKRPNSYQTATEFKSFMQAAALLDGNAFAFIIRSRGKISQLVPLPRRCVTPKLTDTFALQFEYRRPSGGTVLLAQEDVFHFRHPVSLDGLNGVSLLEMAADTLRLAAIAEKAAGRLFQKGTMVNGGGALETDAKLGETAIASLQKSLSERSGDMGSEQWLVLEEGLKAKLLGTNAREAQHLETRKYEAEEISRFTDVPRPLLMFDETSWGSGIEQLGLFFVTYCLMKWFVAWEEAISRSLLTETEQDTLYAKFNEGALLRGSLKDQAEFFAKALGSGGSGAYRTPNEVRGAFDLNPLDGGDTLPAPGPATPVPAAPESTKESTNA